MEASLLVTPAPSATISQAALLPTCDAASAASPEVVPPAGPDVVPLAGPGLVQADTQTAVLVVLLGLARAAEGGAPVANTVARIAASARAEAGAEASRVARRAGVMAVGPLGLCFLPAFVVLGVVPAIVGLAEPLLSGL